jgi:hypothetical protein
METSSKSDLESETSNMGISFSSTGSAERGTFFYSPSIWSLANGPWAGKQWQCLCSPVFFNTVISFLEFWKRCVAQGCRLAAPLHILTCNANFLVALLKNR